jgi:hypothetical protein
MPKGPASAPSAYWRAFDDIEADDRNLSRRG